MKGIDVSSHNDNIDWDKVKQDGIEFAIIRCSYGQNAIDTKFKRNIEECIRVGMPFGVYTYSYALNLDNAVNEANLVIKQLNPYKDKVSYPVIIDMEDADKYKEKNGMPSNSLLVDICEKECNMFEEAGYYSMIYASKNWFETKLNSSKLNRFDKWIAWWSLSAKEKINKSSYGMWQYTEKGKVNGISGNVDLNESFKNYPEIIIEKPESNPEPAPKPVTNSKPILKYKVGDRVNVSSYYASSTAPNNKAIIKNATGTITKVLSNGAKNPYLLDNGNIGWCNDGDIRGYANSKTEKDYYVVKKGDNLEKIAQKYNTTVQNLVKKNNIKDANKIYVGQKIVI